MSSIRLGNGWGAECSKTPDPSVLPDRFFYCLGAPPPQFRPHLLKKMTSGLIPGSVEHHRTPKTTRPRIFAGAAEVSDTGLEPVTSSVSWMRASQLRQSPEGRNSRQLNRQRFCQGTGGQAQKGSGPAAGSGPGSSCSTRHHRVFGLLNEACGDRGAERNSRNAATSYDFVLPHGQGTHPKCQETLESSNLDAIDLKTPARNFRTVRSSFRS